MKKMYQEYLESLFPMDSFHTVKKPLDTSYTKDKDDDEDKEEEPE